MPIPQSQLETWSHQGPIATSSATYRSIQAALSAESSPIKDKDYEVYLQGSYRNGTNIRGDSDVDVVVQLKSTWGRDLSELSDHERHLYEASFPQATYHWRHFRADVLKALTNYYGAGAVKIGGKSLKLAANSGRLAADIIPALHYRRYKRFFGTGDFRYIHGIRFHCGPDGQTVINYPKPHYANGVHKNSEARTNGGYKPTVRMFKNARSYLVDNAVLAADVAPSYFVECLLYNVPDAKFGNSFEDTFVEVFNWLWAEAQTDRLVCQNEQLPLFGGTSEQWDPVKAKQLLDALRELWNNW